MLHTEDQCREPGAVSAQAPWSAGTPCLVGAATVPTAPSASVGSSSSSQSVCVQARGRHHCEGSFCTSLTAYPCDGEVGGGMRQK